MAFNLLDTVRSFLTPDLLDRASSHFGESSAGITKAATAAVPAVLGLFINRAESGDAQGLLNDAKGAATSNALQNPQSLLTSGMDRLRDMFGGAGNNLVSAISKFVGIKSDSASGLLSLLAPLGLGVLGRHAQESNLSPQSLTSYLADQKPAIMNALPAGIDLGFLFNNPVRTAHAAAAPNVSQATRRIETVDEPKRTNWLAWLLLALGVIALIYFLTRNGCNNTDTITTTGDTTVNRATDTLTTTPPPVTPLPLRESTKVRLTDGTEINAFRGGVEDQLVNCLNDAGCAAGKDKWFDFDNINFQTGSAQLTDSSQAQVQNIAAVLKAYPKAKIKIGGYTDKTGNADANKRLSKQRADAVMNAIKSAGGNAAQLVGAEGYGSEFAKMPATASDEERRVDRRIAVQLREK